MADNRMAPLVPLELLPGARIVLEALDPFTGASVSGVTISNVVISGELPEGDTSSEAGRPFYTDFLGD